LGWNDAMPGPPPDTPVVCTVAGRFTAGGGGNCAVWTRGVAFTAGTEPVTSLVCPGALLGADEAKGFSLKRVDSELQPAIPTATTASAIARGRDHERNTPTTQDMAYSLVRNKQFRELIRWR
jgi:hypothetical protein